MYAILIFTCIYNVQQVFPNLNFSNIIRFNLLVLLVICIPQTFFFRFLMVYILLYKIDGQ